MSTIDEETLVKQIWERVNSMPVPPTQEQLQRMVDTAIESKLNDPNYRKMLFNGNGKERRMVGSKFARWGLSVSDVEFLYDLTLAAHDAKPSKFPGPSDELRQAFGDISDAMYLSEEEVKRIDKKAIDDLFPRIPLNNFPRKDRSAARDGYYEDTTLYQNAIRAMDTAESGYGSQLIGTQYVPELWQGARAQSAVFRLIPSFEMTDPLTYVPVAADLPAMLFVAENTASNSSEYATSKTGSNRVALTAKKFVIHQMWSGELQEDSIIPFIADIREQAQTSIALHSDSCVINGDETNAATGNINSDDADPADTNHYLAFDGLRHIGLVDATGQQLNKAGASILYNDLISAKSGMVDTTYKFDWGHPMQPQDLIYVADPFTTDKIGALDEVVNWRIQQGSKLIGNAGEAASILGHPLISSIMMGKTEADGKISATPANNTVGQVVVFNRRAFKVGWRRRVKVSLEELPARDQYRMVHSLRMGFGRYTPTGAASGIKAAYVIFNINLA